MKKEEKKVKIVVVVILLFLPFVKLIIAGLWAMKGNYVYAFFFALASIVWAIVSSAILISLIIKLNTEEVKMLIQNHLSKDKEKTTAQETDLSSEEKQ